MLRSVKWFSQKTIVYNNRNRLTEIPPYLSTNIQNKKFYVEVYGCQMNLNDTEILSTILHDAGISRVNDVQTADIVFLMTCAIREGAEQKIWRRLVELAAIKRKRKSLRIGLLGCMAERLKEKLFDAEMVDVVCGPDAYRSLPMLLGMSDENRVANVMLSADETYADIQPMRLDPSNVSATLSIMRGCNNMCSFCIVPFTRGIEKSRPIQSIVDSVKKLSDEGVKEVLLLGQNVNSYRDSQQSGIGSSLSQGFSTIYKQKQGGMRFTELLDKVSDVDSEMRIRFTSPHPKDFPHELLDLIKNKPNICKQIHLPLQSGSTSCLERMRRGYTREAYIDLVHEIRKKIPQVSISTDIIAGFCGETHDEFLDTINMIQEVKYDQAYMYAYSMRQNTHAHRQMMDDVSKELKQSRLAEIIETHYKTAKQNHQFLLKTKQLVLVEGESRKSIMGNQWYGRADGNLKVHFEYMETIKKGDYIEVEIEKVSGASMTGRFIQKSSIKEFNKI